MLSLMATAPLVLVTPTDKPSGADLLRRRAQRRRQVELRLGGRRLGRPPGHGAVEEPRAGNFGAVHVPYQGNPQVVTALLGGQVQMALIPPGLALPQVRAGKLKAVGLTSRPQHAGARRAAAGGGRRARLRHGCVGRAGRPGSLPEARRTRLAREASADRTNARHAAALFDAGWQASGQLARGAAPAGAQRDQHPGGIIMTQGIKVE